MSICTPTENLKGAAEMLSLLNCIVMGLLKGLTRLSFSVKLNQINKKKTFMNLSIANNASKCC
jgi:hypothetical protein